jgi:tripartite-type tricarboxylate transporter receptor subunit TctC
MIRALLSIAALLLLIPSLAAAQAFPQRPIKFIVPLAAGGTGDTLARAVADEMSKELGQPVVCENRPGAGGLIGAETVLNAPPDGYTILAISPAQVIIPSLYSRPTYDPIKNFEPVTVMAITHQLIVEHPSFPPNNIPELIDYAKKNPGKINYGSSGSGSATHLSMELFRTMAGIDLVHVPYRGSTQARQDVVAGVVQIVVDGLLPATPLIRDGKLKALGLTSSKRSVNSPDIPTVAEQGVPGFASEIWYGIAAPGGTPPEVIATLHRAATNALRLPAVSERLTKLDTDPVANSPEEFRQLLISEQKVWSKVVKDTGAKVE